MTMLDDLRDLYPHVVSVAAPATTKNLRGEGAPGVGVEYPARVVNSHREFRNDGGDVVASETQVWVCGLSGATTEHVITLPDGSTPPLVRVDRFPDEDGDQHEVLYFGRSR